MNDSEPEDGAASGEAALRVEGICHAFFAYDLGFSIDLEQARSRFAQITPRPLVHQRRRAPAWFQYEPLPLRVSQSIEPLRVAGWATGFEVDCTLYDFGAASVVYRIPFDGPLDDLPRLSEGLYDNALLLEDSRRLVEEMLRTLGGAVTDPGINDAVEDYVVFAVRRSVPSGPPPEESAAMAGIVLAEAGRLSPEQAREALTSRVSYGPDDLTIVNWIGALVFDPAADDVLAVLEHANVELLEMRVLDRRLDKLIQRSTALFERQRARGIWPIGAGAGDLGRLSEARMDSALLFEGVNNAIKLVGDQFLARVYRLAAHRLHLETWDANVHRKLETADAVYDRIVQYQSTRRMEVLELVIIVLIALSIVLTFIPWAGH